MANGEQRHLNVETIPVVSHFSESLLRLHEIALKLRWATFVMLWFAAVLLRQNGVAASTVVGTFAVAGLLGVACALDQYLLTSERWCSRLALYVVSIGDLLVITSGLALAPSSFASFPLAYFVPIAVASLGLGVTGGVLAGLLCSITLMIGQWHTAGTAELAKVGPWIGAFVVAGAVEGYICRQWETRQRQVEAMYRWVAALSRATTPTDVVDVILGYLESVIRIRRTLGQQAALQLENGAAVALLRTGEDGNDFSYCTGKGISPRISSRLNLSIRHGMLRWSIKEGQPIWVGLQEGANALVLPRDRELARLRSCFVVPFVDGSEILALGLVFSSGLESQCEIEVQQVRQFSRLAAVSLKKADAYLETDRLSRRLRAGCRCYASLCSSG
ncbi:MAG: hypothetical protein HY675_05545 [Chloroflexi bacterium]|nr:hypothetical protein [Chloroflexota bacterium]